MDPERLLPNPAMAFATPADVIGDATLDNERKRLILRQWQHDAVKAANPCADAVRGPVLDGIMDALIVLKAKASETRLESSSGHAASRSPLQEH